MFWLVGKLGWHDDDEDQAVSRPTRLMRSVQCDGIDANGASEAERARSTNLSGCAGALDLINHCTLDVGLAALV
jgi:hypothetical protein